MAESVVAFLLNQISTFLSTEAILLGGLAPDVQYVKDELGSMTAFLRDVEAKEESDLGLKEGVKQVRQVSYDMEDVLDEFILHFAHCCPDGFCSRIKRIRTSIKTLRARHQIATKIKDIKSRVENISARHQRYDSVFRTSDRDFSSTAVEKSQYDIRGHALLLEEGNLVGIQEPKRQLIAEILHDNPRLKVVSVLGMGGLGKTTLVKRVYEDGNVKRRFDSHAWITVSQRFQIKELFKNMVRQLHNEIREQVPPEVESMDADLLREFVKDFLKDKKFIIILDDVWSVDTWDAIKYALPDGNCGSRVMLTTRIAEVAIISCKEFHGHLHKMKPLSSEESWALFCNKTFQDNNCPSHLEDVSRSILGKCEGLPLAIVAIGGLLAMKDKSKLAEWEIVRRSLGRELEGAGKLDRVKKILFLGYNDLPYYLKSCLLFTSIFPEDNEIDSWELASLWIAEGFVQEREEMTIEEVANEYLNELVNRSLIQAVPHKLCLLVEVHMHDLVREILLSKLRENNFASIVTGKYTRWLDNVRRLVIHDFDGNQLQGIHSKHLRSLVIFGSLNPLSFSSFSKFLHGDPRFLKVLSLRGAQFKIIPKEVFKLFFLKFLDLFGSQVEVIPKSIGKLQKLEYLNLGYTKVEELPIDILKLKMLRELCVCQLATLSKNFVHRGFKAPKELGKLVSLHSLYYIDENDQDIGNRSNNFLPRGFKAPKEFGKLVSLHRLYSIDANDRNIVAQLGKLTQLIELGITKVQKVQGKQLCSSIGKLANLRILCITSIEEDEILDLQYSLSPSPRFLEVLRLDGRLEKVPQWLHSLHSLNRVILRRSGLLEDPLPFLQDLPNLVHVLLHNTYEGETLCFKTGGFQKLEFFELGNFQKLKWLKVEEGALPHLGTLNVRNCELVEDLPQGIQNLKKLQSFGLWNVSNELMMKVQNLDKRSDDYQRIAHIPEIFFANWIDGKWEKRYL